MIFHIKATPNRSLTKLMAIASAADGFVSSPSWFGPLYIRFDEKDEEAIRELIVEADLEITGEEK